MKFTIFLSRTTRPISTKLGIKRPRVKYFKVCSNEGPVLFQGNIKTKQRKYINNILKIFFFRNTVVISVKLGTKHSRVKRIQVCSNKGALLFQKKIIAKIFQRTFQKSTSSKSLGHYQPNLAQIKAFIGEKNSSLCK